MQPFVAPITVKLVLAVGDAVNALPVDPVFHVYVVAPLAVNVAV